MEHGVQNAIICRLYKLFLSILQAYGTIFEENYDERFSISLEVFSGREACIYAHSIFVE
jgi:hypothetical protein